MAERVAIVGAGLAGATCARALTNAGLDVVAFDKGRGAGGRTSTRRSELGRFDHGAQYFTARSDRFQAQLQEWLTAGAAAEWHGRFRELTTASGTFTDAPPSPRYVGTPGMNALVKDLLRPVEVRFGSRVVGIGRDSGETLTLTLANNDSAAGFDVVVVATPPPQAVPLLLPVSAELAAVVERIEHTPCWAAMVAFEAPIPLPGDGIKVTGGPLAWIARDSAKPGRTPGNRWVLHASTEWSQAHLELEADDVAARLLSAFNSAVGSQTPSVRHLAAHRWRFARPATPHAGDGYLLDSGVGVCGDGFGAGRVEAAWASGRDLAEAITRRNT